MTFRAAIALSLTLALSTALSGCVVFESRQDRALEKTAEFKDGYSDGCATASTKSANYAESNMVRDDTLFRTNRGYRQGWSAGYAGCRPIVGPPEPQNGPVADPTPGGH
jgi:hypothetical protein